MLMKHSYYVVPCGGIKRLTIHDNEARTVAMPLGYFDGGMLHKMPEGKFFMLRQGPRHLSILRSRTLNKIGPGGDQSYPGRRPEI